MICILSSYPLKDHDKKKYISYSYAQGINLNDLEFKTTKDFSPLKSYSVVMPTDDKALRSVYDLSKIYISKKNRGYIGKLNCYVLIDGTYTSCPVIPIYHPQEGRKDLTRFLFIKKAIQNAKKYIDNGMPPKPDLKVSNNIKEIDAYLKECEQSSFVCIDLETVYKHTDISPFYGGWKDVITAVGISKKKGEALCFSRSFKKGDDGLPPIVFQTFVDRVAKINANPKIDKMGQNYTMFDAQVLYWWKVSQSFKGVIKHNPTYLPKGNLWDTMHMFNILYPKEDKNVKGISKGLDEIIRMYLLAEFHKNNAYLKQGEELRTYCALDVTQTWECFDHEMEELKERGMENYYQEYRLPLGAPTVSRMILGINIDQNLLKKLKVEASKKVRELTKKMNEKYGHLTPLKKDGKERDYLNDTKIKIEPNWGFPSDISELPRKDLDKLILDNKLATSKAKASDFFITKKQHIKNNPGYELGALYLKAFSHKLIKKDLNPNSPLDLRAVFEALSIRLPRGSTDSAAIQTMLINPKIGEEEKEFIRDLQEVRRAGKFHDTYCSVTLDIDGKLRGSFNHEALDTGRSGCKKTMWGSGLNLQTLPSYYTEVED